MTEAKKTKPAMQHDTAHDEVQGRMPALAAFGGLKDLAQQFDQLDAELQELCGATEPSIARHARKLRKQIRDFEPSVTMIGQVKAGKTTLVNAMAGWPDLLPADVNPWTSVVTSLHMQPMSRPQDRRSAFRFFSNDEWDHLIRQGGRVGEMASRAGADDELEKVRRQLDDMREKSKARLGPRFQMLLGQVHEYDTFDANLIQRYVCLGDDFWEDMGSSRDQGRFADITKSADLWFGGPQLPIGLCIQDTPGVNDTFMIREQITINALRGSRLCVMVLSAQQALSAVDLGLIRLISNVKSRDVIIFVNRIDELADPAREVPEIRASIDETLRKFDGPKDAEIIFGSGYWANHAVAGTVDELSQDSARALLSMAEDQLDSVLAQCSTRDIIWHLSGVPALGQAVADRIERGSGAKLKADVAAALGNLRAGLSAQKAIFGADAFDFNRSGLTPADIARRFDEIESRARATLDAELSKAHDDFSARTENARRTFLGRATGSLVKHLDSYGEGEVWTYDPAGLRMLLRAAYGVFVRHAGKAGVGVLQAAAVEIADVYQIAFGLSGDVGTIEPPPVPGAQAPVALGQTIALDLRGGWWARFWRKRRGYEAFSGDFSRLIHEETTPIVNALRHECVETFDAALRHVLSDFIQTQRSIVLELAGHQQEDPFSSAQAAGERARRHERSNRKLRSVP